MKKFIVSLTLSLLYSVAVWSSDGDTFTTYVNVPKTSSWLTQVEMTFKIISELDKTCQVGDGINRAIDGYPELSKLELPDKVNNYKIVRIGDNAFAQGGLCDITTVVLPSYVTSIGKRAFYLSNLESITFPSGFNTIGEEAFANSKITSIDIPSTVSDIGNRAFASCTKLISFTIPSGVSVLKSGLFSGCTKLSDIVWHNGVTSIGNGVFTGCTSLASISIPESVTTIGVAAFNGCSSLSSITLSSGLTDIQASAFSDCTSLNSITLPSTVTTLGSQAFDGCTNLLTVNLSSNLQTIAQYTFNGCTSLRSITIPTKVAGIGYGAFYGCNSLTSITIGSSSPMAIYESTITNRANATLYVPAGAKTAYESADYWKEFKEIVEMEDAKVELNKTEASLLKGKTMALKASVYPLSTDQSVTWKSSNTKVATVSSAGKVTGVKTGIVTITCTSKATGLSATCKVTVGSIYLDKTEVSILKGTTLKLTPSVYPTTLDDKSVTWESSNTKVATVTSDGEVKGVKTGIVTITCTSNVTGLSAICQVTVGSIYLDKTEVSILKGTTLKLTPSVYPTTLEDKTVTWKSSNTKIATVSSIGKVKGVKTGIVTITCTSNVTGLSATCQVTVGSIYLNKTEVSILKGTTLKLTPSVYPTTLEDKTVTWKSSNTKIATVSSTGKVKGVKTGIVTITCTSNVTGLSATCQVTVGSIYLDKTDVSILKGTTLKLTPSVYPTMLTDKSVTWESSAESVATVTADGIVTGITPGTATITCTSNVTGLSATCQVTVTASSGTRSLSGDNDETTGIEALAQGETEPYDVYDLSGRMVLHQVTSLDGLPNGVYIVNGKKMLKK